MVPRSTFLISNLHVDTKTPEKKFRRKRVGNAGQVMGLSGQRGGGLVVRLDNQKGQR